jgi:SNF2 family DNA or RNA helicase
LQDRIHPNLTFLRQQEKTLERAQCSRLFAAPTPVTSTDVFRCSNLSVKLEKLDQLLRQIRMRGERTLVFCQMPEMLDLLRYYLNSRHFSFTILEHDASLRKRTTQLQWFTERENILVLLVSTATPVAGFSMPSIDNVIFFDANWNNNSEVSFENGNRASLSVSPCLQWCRRLRSRKQNLKIVRLVCEGTVEDTISVKALQDRLLGDIKIKEGPTNGSSVPVFTINRQTLEALFATHFGDNGIISPAKVNENHSSSWTGYNKVKRPTQLTIAA